MGPLGAAALMTGVGGIKLGILAGGKTGTIGLINWARGIEAATGSGRTTLFFGSGCRRGHER